MMEVMIVVAILGVMAALVFVNIVPFMKSFYQKEMDETAQELYVAAQNHLTIAEGMGFLEGKTTGTVDGNDDQIYYFVVAKGGTAQDGNGVDVPTSALSQMLPFGSIDDTVRLGGSYVIRYNPKTAVVLDVFYTNPQGTYGNGASFTAGDYAGLLGLTGDLPVRTTSGRREINLTQASSSETIIGWYGGDSAGLDPQTLPAPTVKVENGDRLLVKVTAPGSVTINANLKVGIIITGRTSGNHTPLLELPEKTGNVFTGCLDDIASTYSTEKDRLATNNGHFADRFSEYGLIPGEDVSISVFMYYTNLQDSKIYKVAKGPTVTTNSLFRSIGDEKDDTGAKTGEREARISHTRHLENLSEAISGYDREALNAAENARQKKRGSIPTPTTTNPMTTASEMANAVTTTNETPEPEQDTPGPSGQPHDFAPTHARQIANISWNDFKTTIGGNTVKVYTHGTGATATADNTFMPVNTQYALAYNGDNHKVSDVAVSTAGNAGLFGAPTEGSSFKNMELVDFDIESTGAIAASEGVAAQESNAGALAGTLVKSTVKNVLVYNTGQDGKDYNLKIEGEGSVGGLVGSVTGESGSAVYIEQCAAAVYVSPAGEATTAGGLIGTMTDAKLSQSYSGGHTDDKEYKDTEDVSRKWNVSAKGAAGGLVGTASSAPIEYSYSTCSASGSIAGGLVGTTDSGVSYCYAVGAVNGGADNAKGYLVGSITAATIDFTGNRYVPTVVGDLKAVGGSTTYTAVDMFPNLAAYNAIVGAHDASPYDSALKDAYNNKYALPTISDLLTWGDGSASGEDEDDEDDEDGEDEEGGATVQTKPPKQLSMHYGDWPMLETEVVNQ